MLPFNEDFRELLSCLLDDDVRFLVIGAYAAAFHGHVRATKDIDLWLTRRSEEEELATDWHMLREGSREKETSHGFHGLKGGETGAHGWLPFFVAAGVSPAWVGG